MQTVQTMMGAGTGVHAIDLVAVYEGEMEPSTKYWINEGTDVVMHNDHDHHTDFPPGATTARFSDVGRNDTENVNATLLTVLGMYTLHPANDGGIGNSLWFNDNSVCSLTKMDHWDYYSDSSVALTSNEWGDVTGHLSSSATPPTSS